MPQMLSQEVAERMRAVKPGIRVLYGGRVWVDGHVGGAPVVVLTSSRRGQACTGSSSTGFRIRLGPGYGGWPAGTRAPQPSGPVKVS